MTRQALINKLGTQPIDTILSRREWSMLEYWKGKDAAEVIKSLLPICEISHANHTTNRGTRNANPGWLKDLYLSLMNGEGNITVGSVLQALGAH